MEIDGVAGGLGIAEPELRGGQRGAQWVTHMDQAWPGAVSHRDGWQSLQEMPKELYPGVIIVGM